MKELKEVLAAQKAAKEKPAMSYLDMITKVQSYLVTVAKGEASDELKTVKMSINCIKIELENGDKICITKAGHVFYNSNEFDLTEDDKATMDEFFKTMENRNRPIDIVAESKRIAEERGVDLCDVEGINKILDEIMDGMSPELRKRSIDHTIRVNVEHNPQFGMLMPLFSGFRLLSLLGDIAKTAEQGKATDHPFFKDMPEELKEVANSPFGAMMMGAAMADVLRDLRK